MCEVAALYELGRLNAVSERVVCSHTIFIVSSESVPSPGEEQTGSLVCVFIQGMGVALYIIRISLSFHIALAC